MPKRADRRLARLERGVRLATYEGTLADLCALPTWELERTVKYLSDEELADVIGKLRALKQPGRAPDCEPD